MCYFSWTGIKRTRSHDDCYTGTSDYGPTERSKRPRRSGDVDKVFFPEVQRRESCFVPMFIIILQMQVLHHEDWEEMRGQIGSKEADDAKHVDEEAQRRVRR